MFKRNIKLNFNDRQNIFSFPPVIYFVISSIFHYLGPSFAVLLFPKIGILGVLWFRVISAALIFLVWKNPIKYFKTYKKKQQIIIILLGIDLALMNTSFYIAISFLPLAIVASIEFLGTIIIAFIGIRLFRNLIALILTIIGVTLISSIQIQINVIGLFFSFINCFLFMIYIILGHSISQEGGISGIEKLGCSMIVASLFIFPLGITEASSAFSNPILIIAGIGVGVCSSVVPYITDQFAMSLLKRSTFALMLSLLPLSALIIGIIVLDQIPTIPDIMGIFFIIIGLLIHREGI